MVLKVYTLEQAEQWDAIVRTFEKYDVYWLSGYVRAFQIHGDGEPLLFYYEQNSTRGINVVMKRDVAQDERFQNKIPERRYYDFITPYGYGGWIIDGEETRELFSTYEQWAKQNGIVSEFVRFHPIIKNHVSCTSFYEVVELGEVVHMDISSPEIIWNNMTSKNRNMIRKAIKNNVKIYNGRFPEIFKDFVVIYNNTMDKDKAEKYYYFEEEFYKSLLEDLSYNAQIFWAEKEGKVISAAIILTGNRYMSYHLSGSLREFNSLAPGNLLLYKIALWGCANGFKTFYLGGGVGSCEDSLFKFKRGFYKNGLNRFNVGKKIYDTLKYEQLLNIRGVATNEYFPAYRAPG